MKTLGVTLAVVSVLLAGAAVAGPASAATQITNASPTPVVAEFADPWLIELQVASVGEDFVPTVGESSGTVDVFIEQVAGTFLEDLTLQADGRVFVTQPPDQPWLAPGTYDLRAVFTPAASTGLEIAQVRIPGAITITPIDLTATVAVETGAAAVTVPTVTISMATTGEQARDSLPPGVWNLSVREAADDEVLLTRQVVQTSALDPLVVELSEELRPGVEHVLSTEFVPVAEYAPGVTVAGTGEVEFRTAAQDLGQLLVTPVDVPIWALVLAIVGVLAGLAGLVTTLAVRSRRRAAGVTPAHDGATDDGHAEHGSTDGGSADDNHQDDTGQGTSDDGITSNDTTK